MKIGFIGLGVMGYPMAGHLQNAGHSVRVFNRTASKAQRWCEQYGGERADTPHQAASDASVVISCVGNDDDLREVTLGERGAFPAISENAVFIDHTTTSAEVASELYNYAKKQGFAFLDAPVSGGQAGAENGQLTVMLGGEAEAFERVREVIGCYAKATRLMGPSGSGQRTKMVNQICIAGLVQALAEALNFAESVGLDPAAVVDVISKGAAQSWQMENRYRPMLERKFDFGFAVDWMRKDLGIAMKEARRSGAALPVTEMVDGFYAQVQQMGGGRWDTCSLIARLSANAPATKSEDNENS